MKSALKSMVSQRMTNKYGDIPLRDVPRWFIQRLRETLKLYFSKINS